MPDCEKAIERVYAWFMGEVIDRAPVRFMAHNAFLDNANKAYPSSSLKERWFDAEFQVETYLQSIEGKTFHGETFPVFWPNLGPEVYSAFYGSELEYGEVTAWSKPFVKTWDDMARLRLDTTNEYSRKLEDMTRCAIERCVGKALVGYTDLHPGVDCAAAWRDPAQLCLDLIESPGEVQQLLESSISDFEQIYNHFDGMLKDAKQLSVSWMGIPSFGRMHIPSCDFSALISPMMFDEFCLPILQREVKTMTHNIFHMDGKNVARHRDRIFSVPEVHAVQWVQGVGDDLPIMQWLPLIKEIQAHRPLTVDLSKHELDAFMAAIDPEGIFLWIATENEDEELELLKRISRWTHKQ
jgi:hypothetical protein